MKKALAAGSLVFAMILSTGGAAAASEADAGSPEQLDYSAPLHYELESAGTIEDPDGNFSFLHDAVMDRSREEPTILSSSGEVMAEGLDDIDYIGGGLYITRTPLEEDNVNKTGLITTDGEVLIPGDAASIVTPDNREKDGSIRFLGVIFTTEETDSEDDCIIYFTSDMFSLSVGEDDVMYKGYFKIYDVGKKQYVPDVQLTSADRYGLHDLGDSFLVEHEGKVTQYDPDGKVLYESEEILGGVSYHFFSIREGEDYKIIDSTGKDTYTHEGYQSIYTVSEPLDYFDVYEDGEGDLHYYLIDSSGNRILEDQLPTIYGAYSNVYTVDGGDSSQKVLDYEGNVVDDAADSCYFPFGGYGRISHDDSDTVTVITPDSILKDLTENNSGMLIYTKDDKIVDLTSGEVLGAGYTSEDIDETLCPGLISIYDPSTDHYSDPKISVYDVLSGKELLPGDYQEINTAGNYLYANPIGTDTWEVYKIHVVSDAA